MSCQTGNDPQYNQPSTSTSNSAWPPSTSATILALVIGINEYPATPNLHKLQCAVSDADDFEKFLKEHLNVPDKNIISLRDGQASRTEILSSFFLLRDNKDYKKNEAAIIIYYAGHGAYTPKPEGWQDWYTSSGRIEMLCPSDIGTTWINEEHQDVIRGIPDRTISALLNQISFSKGNNITLILDCCYSAGINRAGDLEQYMIRRMLNPPPIENNTDKEIWSHSTRDADGAYGMFNASHVLLAACGRDQSAREIPEYGGIFTYNLMKVLKDNNINTLTYTSLIDKMKMLDLSQTAHCEGQEVHRRLFNNHAPGASRSLILARGEISPEMGSTIILEAGATQGITRNSRMAVYASNLLETASTSNPRLGYLTATSVQNFTCVLEGSLDTIQQFHHPSARSFQFYCLLEYRASALYCQNKDWLKTVFPPEQEDQLGITIVDDPKCCDLELIVIDGKVHFDRHNDVLVTPHIGARISRTIDVGDLSAIREVVRCSSHFYHHLTRTGGVNLGDACMELKLLKQEIDEDFASLLVPTGRNLIAEEPATIVVDEDAHFGMTIFNPFDQPLYPYVFYFDPTDLTIVAWNTPPFGAGPDRVDAPLLPGSTYTLGCGSSGTYPWQFMLEEGEKKDVNFFKLFFCSRFTDLSSILQPESPFAKGTCRHGGPADCDVEWWATKLVTIIQVNK